MNIQLEGNLFQGAVLPLDPLEPSVQNSWLLLHNLDPTIVMGNLIQYNAGGYVFRGHINSIPVNFTIQPNDVIIS